MSALRVPRGLLLHDAMRWRLHQLPAELAPDRLQRYLEQHGLDAQAPVPPPAPRLRQIFWVARDQIPAEDFQIAPGARYACVACGTSCRTFQLGPLLPGDIDRLLAADWSGTGHDPATFFVDDEDRPGDPHELLAAGRQVFLRRGAGGCQFLREDNLCEVHARFGADTKPILCRLFPYNFRAAPDGVVVTLRLGECASAEAAMRGALVAEQREELDALFAAQTALGLVPPVVWLQGKPIAYEEYERVEAGLLSAPRGEANGAAAELAVRTFRALGQPAASGRTQAGADPQVRELLRRASPQLPLAASPLTPEALDMEDRFVRQTLFNKDLFQAPDLATGAALLLVKTFLCRHDAADGSAASLNLAWKHAGGRDLAGLVEGFDLPELAASIAG